MRDWHRRLSVAPDAARGAEAERGAAAGAQAPQEIGGGAHSGQHEFVPEGQAPLPGVSRRSSIPPVLLTRPDNFST